MGKRGPCKGCGKPITIPDGPDDSPYKFEDDNLSPPTRARRSNRWPPSGGGSGPRAVGGQPHNPAVKKQEKEAAEPLLTLWGPEPIWGGPGTRLNMVVRGVAGIGPMCILAVAAVLLARAGRASRADVENLARAEVQSLNALTKIFQSADDAASAQDAAGKAVPVIKAWTERVKEAAKKRARNEDMDEVLAESLDPIQTAAAAMWKEVGRVQSIPDADPAVSLTLKPAFDELLAIVPWERTPDGPLKHSTPVILPVPTRDAPAALKLSARPPRPDPAEPAEDRHDHQSPGRPVQPALQDSKGLELLDSFESHSEPSE